MAFALISQQFRRNCACAREPVGEADAGPAHESMALFRLFFYGFPAFRPFAADAGLFEIPADFR
jgi:hypothetical protein